MRALLMPVGPLGVSPNTVQLLIGLVVRRAVRVVQFGTGHVVPARNEAWRAVLELETSEPIDRVLWIDTDMTAPLEQLVAWLDRCDERFEASPSVGWIGPVYARRGGGWAYRPAGVVAKTQVKVGDELQNVDVEQPVLAGLGIAVWHVPRVLAALERASVPRDQPFSWVPPYGEDTGLAVELSSGGCEVEIDPTLPTVHDGIGSWLGAERAPHEIQPGGA